MKGKKSLESYYVSPKQKERDSLGLPPIKIAWVQVVELEGVIPPPPTDDESIVGLFGMLSDSFSSDDSLFYSI